jgi:VIT1/CCC1 family predicted Fe2+/Mn2+ transporter
VRQEARERIKTLAQQTTWIATVSTAVWTFLNNVGTAFLHILPYLILGAALIGLAYIIAVALVALLTITAFA